jgi:hypothetical protein
MGGFAPTLVGVYRYIGRFFGLEPKFVRVVVVPALALGVATAAASRQARPVVNLVRYVQIVPIFPERVPATENLSRRSVQVPHGRN